MNRDEGDKRSWDNPSPHPDRGYQEKEEKMRLWGILIFGLIGATATTFAVTQLRSTVDWIYLQRNDWYWKEDTSFRDHGSNFRETPKASASASLSHHYSVLGLDRLRSTPYTDDEIKSAFRAKAKQFHPDQNQDNKGGKFMTDR
ncbi:UNVERIFIED_CONTAM: hypothetical protein Sradi_2438400 [Sesamum radiatum]|uniref:J domain-containing protein n=1 Tax=Sesamum radiatum TaxID=300843 RepID=A0AAW2SKK7_SESRA